MLLSPKTQEPQSHAKTIISDTNDHRQKSATEELLRLLCIEIAKDGGASLVTSLKDYVPINGKRLNSLLYLAIGKTKLLSFLEGHSDIFDVNRNATPHWVKLLSREHVRQEHLLIKFASRDKAKIKVLNKALYGLQKRQAKLNRRRQRNTRTTAEDTAAVNIAWLIGQCVGELHSYLRDAGIYLSCIYPQEQHQEVQLVGSRPWQDLVLPEFESLLTQDQESRFTVTATDGKTWLSSLDQEDNDLDDSTLDSIYLDQLEECLTRLVDQDGGHEVRLDLLLHRHKILKDVLGGRDLKVIHQQHPERFQSMEIRQEGPDLIFASKQHPHMQYGADSRMMVDEVGLYSVTNTKWGNAIGNIMVHCCRTTTGIGSNENFTTTTAVDLTASVGGMTMGLAKTRYFHQILAFEIDPTRARLCSENMKLHGMQGTVTVQNQDAMEAIPSLSTHSCFVVDPPWGGVRFKQKTEQYANFSMGPWTFKQVLINIYNHCKPCLVGMRLPENRGKVDALLEELREDGLIFETKAIRKLSVQRFVVLYFPEQEQRNARIPS
jgi:16S rRNA G966 N2-methylase RsmD